ncbi:MAG: DNA polymerase III subunit delta' [Desulfobacterales bacterium]
MGGFSTLIGQQRPAGMLCNALVNQRLPHALLFTGEHGVGKATAALELARISNCSDLQKQLHARHHEKPGPGIAACGTCRNCRKITGGTHPDVHVIKPSGGYIRIDRIRAIYGSLALKSDEETTRFVLVEDAHLMNREAGNCLLKILEEPPYSTIFVLIAPDTGNLLPTIVSRCRHIRFNPIPQNELADYLVSHQGLEPDHAMVAASLARGSLARALDMGQADWISYRNFIVDLLVELPELPAAFRYAFAEMLAANRDKLEGIFEILKNWYRDLAVFQRSPESIYNQDIRGHVETASLRMPLELIIEKSDAVVRAESALAANANPRLALDAMLAKLAQ